MEETYRMLGREHQADLDREASTRALASLLPARPPIATRAVEWFAGITSRLRTRQPVPRPADGTQAGLVLAGALPLLHRDPPSQRTPLTEGESRGGEARP
jgi:hypothetical protein